MCSPAQIISWHSGLSDLVQVFSLSRRRCQCKSAPENNTILVLCTVLYMHSNVNNMNSFHSSNSNSVLWLCIYSQLQMYSLNFSKFQYHICITAEVNANMFHSSRQSYSPGSWGLWVFPQSLLGHGVESAHHQGIGQSAPAVYITMEALKKSILNTRKNYD